MSSECREHDTAVVNSPSPKRNIRVVCLVRVKAYVKVGGQSITSDEQLFTTATTGKAAPTIRT